ncbi:DUF5686 family protein [Parabacteroides sp. PF5-9]|uniref:DUF5686 family protein n=1 Tax=Parabacteroides sp. PF5-9 TaxID=1742404 RepID=UPI002474ECF0|nr:DUF5686 family protein [Parabacteroides sp. PF5-9]MDH6359143.1 hypothetical protein [Parabacteroides sp. PF5-9]
MKKKQLIFILSLFSVSVLADNIDTCSDDDYLHASPIGNQIYVDSIMQHIITSSAKHANQISRYKAEIYIKGRTEILKENYLIRFGHHLFPLNRRNKDMLFEMVSESEYNAPNHYIHNFKAVNGNSIPNSKKQQEVLTFLNMNVYSSTNYEDEVITPMARNAMRLYDYSIQDVIDTLGTRVYKIRFLPKQLSQRLVSGEMYIRDNSWLIEKIDLYGRYYFAEFNLKLSFSQGFHQFLLPDKAELNLRYNILGNVVASTYHTSLNYKEVEWVAEDNDPPKWKPLDLTDYFELATDTIPIIRDSTYWNKKRDQSLTEEELQILYNREERIEEPADTTNHIDYLELTEQLTNTIKMDYKTTRIRYSGILNPLQLGYSGRNGITYKQRLRINKTLTNGRELMFRPEIGYVFKRKEIFFKIGGEYLYKPEKKGAISLMIANGNQSYSSKLMKEIEVLLKDSVINFNDLNLDCFRDYYLDLRNTIELSNGLLFSSGLTYHRRVPEKKKIDIDPGDDVEELLSEDFNDFVPFISLSYTPRQFYRMNGHRKQYVYSYYPTISIEYGQAIPDVLGSLGNYGRIEMQVHQSLPLGSLRRMNYYVSGGAYINAKSTYFADFRYFARRNFPESWEDRIGGVFHQLNRYWFNASDRYVQAHLMYESPFILSQLFKKKVSKYVLSERVYFGQLWTPVLPSYTEVGYGFGNLIFNVAVFAGFDRWKYEGLGVRFTFELD